MYVNSYIYLSKAEKSMYVIETNGIKNKIYYIMIFILCSLKNVNDLEVGDGKTLSNTINIQ